MKKLFLIVLSVLFFSFFSSFNKSLLSNTPAVEYIEVTSDVDYVEYVLIGDQWYKITYYLDGSVGVEPVNRPPQD